ncbi:uncharacterized protein Dwil_GK20501 [Drosophila willistoni]|nr:5'-nucleotidase domain-containing protein 1 [Drosophila willistoni]EDW79484.2 uncharacterized protein Dwil_GK20501 [Drosophila willistoni]
MCSMGFGRLGQLLAQSCSFSCSAPTLLATSTTKTNVIRTSVSVCCQIALRNVRSNSIVDVNGSRRNDCSTNQLIRRIRRCGPIFPANFYSRYSASTIMTSYCKELNFDEYEIIGFDLDGTLLRYNIHEMTILIYNVLRRYLVEERGYSKQLLEQSLNVDFLQKGLFLDGPRGNVLKLGKNATILRATHGTRRLTDEEIVSIYGAERQWNVTSNFYQDPLSTWNGVPADQMRALLDYFDMPAAMVFAQAVDQVDKEQRQQEEYQVWRDLQAALMHSYNRDHFSNDISSYFKDMKAEPQKYVLKTSPKVINWLEQLRSNGKKLFLLTGSNIDFANLTATQALGENWRNLFDIVVTYAKKPGFFTSTRPFLKVNASELKELSQSEQPADSHLSMNEIYSQGNWHQLHNSLAHQLQKPSANVKALYFGDNIIQDVYTPVAHRDFDAVAIAEEMLVQDSEYPYKKEVGSGLWGSYFSVESTPTIWSDFICNFAQICVPSMDHLAQTPPNKRILCTNHIGFYPKMPKELESSI